MPATRALQFTRNHIPLGSRCSLPYAQCNPSLLYYIISFNLRGFDFIIRSVVGTLHPRFHILLIDFCFLCFCFHYFQWIKISLDTFMSVEFSIVGKNPNCSIFIASITLITSVDSRKLVFLGPQTAHEKEWHHFESVMVLYAAKGFWPPAA